MSEMQTGQTAVNDPRTQAVSDTNLTQRRSADVHGWQPIETAPKDGTPVLLGFPGNLHALVGHCEADDWGALNSDFGFDLFSVKPTHWMPLPSPPKETP